MHKFTKYVGSSCTKIFRKNSIYFSRVNQSTKLQKHFCLLKNKFDNLVPLNGRSSEIINGSKSFLVIKFHTTRSCQALSPFIYTLFRPIVNLLAILVGKRIKTWWSSLSASEKEEVMYNIQKQTQILLGLLLMLFCGSFSFYVLHITETPITKRKRFIVHSKKSLIQVAELQQKLLHKVYGDKVLPKSSPLHLKVSALVSTLLKNNQDVKGINEIHWKVLIVNEPLERNVFVLPDGSMYIFTGIFDVCNNNDQLAFIVAHEMSHVLLSHLEESISKGYLIEMIMLMPILLFWATMPTQGAIILHWMTNRLTEIMINLPFSRKIEIEADTVGLHLIAKACFDVREVITFWKNMSKKTNSDYVVEWLSTHPNSFKRQEYLKNIMQSAIDLRRSCKCPPLRD